MEAIEFETFLKKGKINLPEKYKEMTNKKVKVILLFESKDELNRNKNVKDKKKDVLEFFNQYQIDLKDFRFNRDEIHER